MRKLSYLILCILALVCVGTVTAQEVKHRISLEDSDEKSVAPNEQSVWIKGHWKSSEGQYEWVEGYWVEQKEGYTWIDGEWSRNTRSGWWVWTDGYWRKTGGDIQINSTETSLSLLQKDGEEPAEKALYIKTSQDK